MKLWAKILGEDDKISANRLFRCPLPLTQDNYEAWLPDICHAFDLATPVSLRAHYNHLARFNIVEYKPRDFLEPVSFRKFVIENVDYDD